MPFPDWLVFYLSAWVDRTCGSNYRAQKEFTPGITQGYAGPKPKRVPPEKSRTQDAFVEIESLSKGGRRPGQSGRRYMIMSSFLYLRTERALHAALRIPQYSAVA